MIMSNKHLDKLFDLAKIAVFLTFLSLGSEKVAKCYLHQKIAAFGHFNQI